MREFFYAIEEHLRNGLCPDDQVTTGAPYLAEAQNAVPVPYGVKTPRVLTAPYDGEDITEEWPFPQLFEGEETALLCGQSTIYEVASDYTLTELNLDIEPGGQWQVVFFGNSWFATNGETFAWKIAANADGYGFADAHASSDLKVNCLAKINNRLVLGGVSGAEDGYGSTYFDSDQWAELFQRWKHVAEQETFTDREQEFYLDWILWSDKGGGADDLPFALFLAALGLYPSKYSAVKPLIMTSIEQHEIGMRPVSGCGPLLAMRDLGGNLACYGDRACVQLTPDGTKYQPGKLYRIPIDSRSVLAGDELEHRWLSGGRMKHWVAGEPPQDDDFEHVFSGVENVVAAFDPEDREFYFSDGVLGAYVMNKQGLGGPCRYMPTSDILPGGMASIVDTGNQEMLVRVWPFDARERGTKHVTCVQVQYEGLQGRAVQVKWRTGSQQFKFAPWCAMSPDGVAYPGVSFIDASVAVRGTPGDNNGSIGRIEVRYNGEDRTHRRGTSADNPAAD